MKPFRLVSLIVSVIISINASFAQIGYQVSLLNNATGEPRANETVAVTVEITNSEGATVCSETKTETTNDFGVLSMTVGSDATFAKTDWSKLPFYISASVDGVLIGRSQLLSVPIAECAKTVKSCKDILMSKTWKCVQKDTYAGAPCDHTYIISFNSDFLTYKDIYPGNTSTKNYAYSICANVIIGGPTEFIYDPTNNHIVGRYGMIYK